MTNLAAPANGKLLYSTKELAQASGLSVQSIRNEIRDHNLIAIQFGTKYLIEPEEAEAWVRRLRETRTA